MKKFLVFLFAVFAMQAAYAAELDGLIDARAELWKMSGQTVMKNYPDLFVWMDQGRTRLRYNVRENRAPLTLFGRRVLEVIIDVKDEKICELNVSVYNRGDAGEIPKKTFDALLDAAENRLAGKMFLRRRTFRSKARGFVPRCGARMRTTWSCAGVIPGAYRSFWPSTSFLPAARRNRSGRG